MADFKGRAKQLHNATEKSVAKLLKSVKSSEQSLATSLNKVSQCFADTETTTRVKTRAATTSAVSTSTIWLSSLTPSNVKNGWGVYEKDKSNGETAPNDGRAITLNGVVYARGLGVHAISDQTYDISGKNAKSFDAVLGVDDEVGNFGSVNFQVYVDAKLVFNSGIFRGATASQKISIPVTGARTLRLVVGNGNDDLFFDHADWADAHLTIDTSSGNGGSSSSSSSSGSSGGLPTPIPSMPGVPPGFVPCSGVDIRSYGATPNDGQDDSTAIQNALNANVGKTVCFAPGTYNVNRKVTIPSGGAKIGANRDATLISADNSSVFSYAGSAGLQILNINFDGGAIYMDNGDASNVIVDHCNFTNVKRSADMWGARPAIAATGSLAYSTFSNSSFDGGDDNGATACVFAWRLTNTNLLSNHSTHMGRCFKTNNQGSTAYNINMAYNLFEYTRGMAAEWQGAGSGMQVHHNWYWKPVMTSNFPDNDSTFAYSLIFLGANTKNNAVYNNYIYAPERPDGTGVRIGFEMGNGAVVTQNIVDGINSFVALWDGPGPSSVINNKVSNALANIVGPAQCPSCNNTPTTDVHWTPQDLWVLVGPHN